MARIDEPLYPPLAMREALANAFCHCDYAMSSGFIGLAVHDDRLELTSAVPLRSGTTPDDLFGPHESRPWNPLVARTFYRHGIIEEWGRGTFKMAELVTAAGLPRPEIEERGDCVTVRFRRADYVPSGRNGNGLLERQEAILALLAHSEDGLPLREILARLPLRTSERQVRRALAALRNRGLAESSGRGPAAGWRRIPSGLG